MRGEKNKEEYFFPFVAVNGGEIISGHGLFACFFNKFFVWEIQLASHYLVVYSLGSLNEDQTYLHTII